MNEGSLGEIRTACTALRSVADPRSRDESLNNSLDREALKVEAGSLILLVGAAVNLVRDERNILARIAFARQPETFALEFFEGLTATLGSGGVSVSTAAARMKEWADSEASQGKT